ncbi:methylmalonyl-CoA mutase small subunit [Rhodococcus sp. NPDC003382]|uniref:methylmalonyl-CoA mutase small subunit n=1 Tax=unclassified Rhodococcus (in: high G+C Gram-positive bacteria) TaxID=192944 RepID=UPI0018CDE5CD|nr:MULTISPECIES: methylmalonyl-CoA mutase small subunit [unclassified Rhodococcus (in: high G+C Gram-positive bacteria)]MBH0120345.1 methylmalonyl-CoA mutase small subunit [Rhodococcus sp. CX]MCK8672551.1 methylmalonyl-CoA mutase small subunit [Rhodococcus sp. HM1]
MSLAAEAEDAARAYAQWQNAVAGVLAKSRRVEPAELGPEPQRLLETTTYDDITVNPLYGVRDERPEAPLPGEFPYVRGASATRDVNAGWLVSAQFGGSDAAAANERILAALENGVSALWLQVGAAGLPVDALPAVLDKVLLDLAPVTLDAGADTAAAAEALYALLDARTDVADRGAVRIGLGAAPLTSAFSGRADVTVADAIALATAAADRAETVRAVTVDGTAFHNAGASDAEELGAAIAAGLEYLRELVAAGRTAANALGQIEFRLAATDDQFQTIAKFRAGRQVWARIAQVVGAADAGNAPQHAVTSAAMMTQRDPWVNMLRTTLAAFGAGVGGADSVTVLPFDVALPAGALDVSEAFSERIARNTQLLLLEESNLGRVLDPGAGSWYIEELTAQVAGKAWEFFQQIEAAGGYRAALDAGVISERIAATRARRESDIAHRRTSVTGVNEFPNLGETPLPADVAEAGAFAARYAAPFEALRDRSDAYLAAHGARPKVLLAPLGPIAEHNIRSTFATNLLAAGGIEAVNPGTLALDTIAHTVAESGATVAVLCGTDKRYDADAGPATAALRAAGISTVLLAGPEKAVGDVEGEARPDGFLTAKIDAIAALTDLLNTLGA